MTKKKTGNQKLDKRESKTKKQTKQNTKLRANQTVAEDKSWKNTTHEEQTQTNQHQTENRQADKE